MLYETKSGEGNGIPLQYSCLENPMDGEAWWAPVHGVAKSRTRLSDFMFTFHFHALEKEMATYSSVLACRIPGTGEPGGLPSMGSHRVGRDWSNLAAAAAVVSWLGFIFCLYSYPSYTAKFNSYSISLCLMWKLCYWRFFFLSILAPHLALVFVLWDWAMEIFFLSLCTLAFLPTVLLLLIIWCLLF